MSTLEKAILLLHEMPEQSLEIVYSFMRFIQSEQNNRLTTSEESAISKSIEGLHVLQSFAGTLPTNFDYKKELEEARNEKHGRFN